MALNIEQLQILQNRLGYSFSRPELLVQALTHRSYSNAQPQQKNNEVLEFLGDAVVDLVVGWLLIKHFPEHGEGDLSKHRSNLVNEMTLAKLAGELSLSEFILLGRGEAMSGGMQKPRLLSSALEAIIGAVFNDGGYAAAETLVERLLGDHVSNASKLGALDLDFKTRFQEIVQQSLKQTPRYRVVQEEGPDHSKTFLVEVSVDGKVIASASGRSKKQAEQEAARGALEVYRND